jgi:hypothetical protein
MGTLRRVEPGPAGLQPAAQAAYARGREWSCGESNPGPSVCRADALPTELQPHTSGTGESNPARPRPERGPVTEPVVPEMPGRATDSPPPAGLQCHPLWSSQCTTPPGRSRRQARAAGFEPTRTGLEPVMLAVTSRPYMRNAALSRCGWAASTRLSALSAPPAPRGVVGFGAVKSRGSPGNGRDRADTRREALRLLAPAHRHGKLLGRSGSASSVRRRPDMVNGLSVGFVNARMGAHDHALAVIGCASTRTRMWPDKTVSA